MLFSMVTTLLFMMANKLFILKGEFKMTIELRTLFSDKTLPMLNPVADLTALNALDTTDLLDDTVCKVVSEEALYTWVGGAWEFFLGAGGSGEPGNAGGFHTLIQTVANSSYLLVAYAGCDGNLLGVKQKAGAAGTPGTFTVTINGVAVTSLTDVVVSTTGVYTATTGNPTFTRGDAIGIVYTGTTAVTNHAISVDYAIT